MTSAEREYSLCGVDYSQVQSGEGRLRRLSDSPETNELK